MTDEQAKDTVTSEAVPGTEDTENAPAKKKHVFMGNRKPGRREGGRRGKERQKPEFDQQMINIRRVTRVVAGGRRFSFSVAMVIGNRKGLVGFGIGKGADTANAIDKAVRQARRAVIKIPLTRDGSIAHEVRARVAAAEVIIKPAPGKGLSAGSAVRTILALGGVKDVNGKVISRSHNKTNIARAAMSALSKLRK